MDYGRPNLLRAPAPAATGSRPAGMAECWGLVFSFEPNSRARQRFLGLRQYAGFRLLINGNRCAADFGFLARSGLFAVRIVLLLRLCLAEYYGSGPLVLWPFPDFFCRARPRLGFSPMRNAGFCLGTGPTGAKFITFHHLISPTALSRLLRRRGAAFSFLQQGGVLRAPFLVRASVFQHRRGERAA